MSTLSTLVNTQNRVIHKLTAVDCVAGETSPAIDCGDFDYAVIYGKVNTSNGGGATGRIDVEAYYADDTTGKFASLVEATNGTLETYVAAVASTTSTTVIGSVLTHLPGQIRLIHDGGNSGTALTVDIYIELGRTKG